VTLFIFACCGIFCGQTAGAQNASVGVMLPEIELPFRAIDLPVELPPQTRSEIVAYMRYITVTEAPILQSFWVEALQRRGVSAVALNASTTELAQDQAQALHVKMLLNTRVAPHNVDYSNMEMALEAAAINGAAMAGELVPGGSNVTDRVEALALKKLEQQANNHSSRRSLQVKYSLSRVGEPGSPLPSSISHASNDPTTDLWSACVEDLIQAIISQDAGTRFTPASIQFPIDSHAVRFIATTHNSLLIRGKSLDQIVTPALGSGGSKLKQNSQTGKMYDEARSAMENSDNQQVQLQFSASTIVGQDMNQRAILNADSDRIYVLNPGYRSFFTMSTAEAKVAFNAMFGGLQPVELIPTSSGNDATFTYDVKLAPGAQIEETSLYTGSDSEPAQTNENGPDCTVDPPGLTPKQVNQFHSACEKARKMQTAQHQSENRAAEKSPSTVEIEFGHPNANWFNAVQSFRQAQLSPFLYQTVQFGSDPYLSGAIWHEVIAHGAPPTHVRISVGNSRGVNQSTDIVWSDPTAADPGFAIVPSDWTQRANPQLDILFGSPVEPLAWRIFNAAMKIAARAGYRIP
jgi:hypothetical protein